MPGNPDVRATPWSVVIIGGGISGLAAAFLLRDSGLATVRPSGTRRLYAVNSGPLQEVDVWLDRFRRFWTPHLEALGTELARGQRERRLNEERESS